MTFTSIKFKILRAPSAQMDDSFGFQMAYAGGNAFVHEIPMDTRQYPGEFEADPTVMISRANLAIAIGDDYINSGAAPQIIELPIEFNVSGTDEFTITATEYGVTFTSNGTADWYELVELVPEEAPVPTELTGTITAEASDDEQSYPPCTHAKFNIAFDNATYPVTLSGTLNKVINNASESFYYWYRGFFQPLTIEATDADGKEFSQTHPTLDKWTIAQPSIVEQSPGFTITAETTANYKGDISASLTYKLDDRQWQALSKFYNVPAGAHTITIKDNYGCEQSINFECGEIELTQIYLADNNQRCERVARITNPANPPERINMHVVFPSLGNKEFMRSLPPVEVEENVFEVTFDLNNLLSGELEQYLLDKDRFQFPAESGNVIIDRSNLLLEFYTDASYSYEDANGNIVPGGRIDNSGNPHHYALHAGVDNDMQAHLHNLGISFDQWIKNDEQIKWLSNIPEDLQVHPSQPLRLWLLNNNAMSNLRLKTQAYYTDGTNSGVNDQELESVSFGLFEICCGLDELDLPSLDITKKITHYQVWIEGLQGAVPISTEKQQFIVNRNEYERNDILFFRTSLGVHEVLWCNGRRSEQINVKGQTSTRPLTEPSHTKGRIRATRGSYSQSFNMNTGWFPKDLRHYLLDFVAAGEAVLPVDNFLRPVILKADAKYPFGEDDKDLFSLAFGMSIAHKNQHYTKRIVEDNEWGQFSDTFNEAFNI
ncbi:hypothetical protein [Carboxylicivirga marina]|uniref:hypothetical protein n=1 Tax=Carboxylicivirga marina TaxID=2800988 RepID=UPI002593E12C|nr:hypothetical protein [uncultured Carboxylicivirga sp.]